MTEKNGTYVTQINSIFYAAFKEEIVKDFTGMTRVDFIQDFPLFDELNPLVNEIEDLREIAFDGLKLRFFISDRSSLIHQLRLGLSEKGDTVNVICVKTTLLLTTDQAKGFLSQLEKNEELKTQEDNWHIKNAELNAQAYKDQLKKTMYKYIVA